MDFLERIDEALRMCIEEQNNPDASIYLPDIIKSLEKMHDVISNKKANYDQQKRKKSAAAFTKMILDDGLLSKSELGKKLFKISSEFAESK